MGATYFYDLMAKNNRLTSTDSLFLETLYHNIDSSSQPCSNPGEVLQNIEETEAEEEVPPASIYFIMRSNKVMLVAFLGNMSRRGGIVVFSASSLTPCLTS